MKKKLSLIALSLMFIISFSSICVYGLPNDNNDIGHNYDLLNFD